MADKKYSIILAASDQTRAAFDSAKRNIQGLEAPLLSIKSAFGALAGGLVISTLKNLSDEYLQAAMSSNKLAAVLRSTGYAAGLTAAELENLVQQTSRMALIDDEQVRDGVSALLLFRNVQGDVAKAAIRLGAEMTQLGGDMSSAMQQIGSALESPLDAGKKLKAMGVFVSDGQQEMIKSMMESGDIAGAQGMILDLLNAKYGDLSATMNTGAIADSKRLTIAWGELLETMGKAPAESGLSGWAASRLTEINNIIEQSTIAERTMLMIPGLRTYARAAIAGRAAESGSQASAAEQAQADAGAVLKAQQDLQQKLDAFLANDEQEGMKRLKRISDATKKQNEEDDKDVIEKAKKAYEYGEKQTADLINKQQERFIAMRQMAEDSDASDLERSQLKQERLLADLEQQRMIMATDHELTLA
ncbi:MAG: hypothetical protein A2143_01770 [Gallionellales bacterium RBG_16_57_15]|nr:MAG: hypothetical protein A2143_01770 [Gallionellales bacterium RBG_16_57_15]